MKIKEEFYKYGESLGIKINDLQRLKMLADNCQEDMADKKYTEEDMREAMIIALVSNSVNGSKDIDDYINSLNKQD